jgi:hypothetical protein
MEDENGSDSCPGMRSSMRNADVQRAGVLLRTAVQLLQDAASLAILQSTSLQSTNVVRVWLVMTLASAVCRWPLAFCTFHHILHADRFALVYSATDFLMTVFGIASYFTAPSDLDAMPPEAVHAVFALFAGYVVALPCSLICLYCLGSGSSSGSDAYARL